MPGRIAHGTYAHDLGRRHPFELAMLGSGAAVGVSRLLATTSGTLESALPPLVLVGWYALLTLGSGTALTGVFWREPVTGLLLERAGLIAMMAACPVYSAALLIGVGWRAVAAAGFVLGFAGASTVRALDIGRILVRMRALTLATEVILKEEENPE